MLGAAAAAGLSAVRGLSLADAPAVAHEQLTELTAVEAVGRMSRGELTCERYAQALLERCRAARALNAFITLDPARVLEDARARDLERRAGARPGPLFGLPIPVKDSVNTRDYPTTGGTPALKDFRPKDDAPVVAALRSAGAIVLGKTNLHELSFGWTSNNLAYGAVHNPYDPGAHSRRLERRYGCRHRCTDGAFGYSRGYRGLHPRPGRVLRHPGLSADHGTLLDAGLRAHLAAVRSGGPARTQRRGSAVVRFGRGPRFPSVRIRLASRRSLGIVRDYWFEDLDPEVERVTALALKRLEQAGAVLVEAPLAGVAQLIALTTDQVQNHDVRVALPRYLAEYGTGLTLDELIERASPDIKAIFHSDVLPGGANFVAESVYAAARDRYLPELKASFRDYFASTGVAAMIFPATRVPPPRIGDETTLDIRGHAVAFEDAVARNIASGSTAGLPGLVLPAGLTSGGLPVAVELDAPEGSDRALLALGVAIEQALGPLPAPRA